MSHNKRFLTSIIAEQFSFSFTDSRLVETALQRRIVSSLILQS